MRNHRLTRRGFLGAGLATATLAATSHKAGTTFAAPADAAEGKLEVRGQEHYGDVTEQLALSPSWETKVYHMAGHNAPVLSAAEIKQRLLQPIGTKLLRDLATGKRNAVITFDDLTRPTPTFEILPHVIDELKAGGIPEDRILLLTSYGSHSPMQLSDVARKAGRDIAKRFPWLNHNIWEQVTEVGRTSLGNLIKINQHFARADLRVCISGIKVHGTAGYGGGAKAVLPGIAWAESISYMHRTIGGVGQGKNESVGAGKIFTNDCRKDMEEAARLARVDFTVQTVYNGQRQVVGIFAGDVVDAFRDACRMASKHYKTAVAKNADIVVVNAYPQNAQPFNGMGWAQRSLRDGGSVVLITQFPPGMESIHFMRERWVYEVSSFWAVDRRSRSAPIGGGGQLIVYSQSMPRRDQYRFAEGTTFAQNWEDVLAALGKAHPSDAQVAVYPYAPIQHPPLELDEPT